MEAPKTRALTIRFTEDDRALLTAVAEVEERSAGSILRRALRLYAETMGIAPSGKPKHPRKKAA